MPSGRKFWAVTLAVLAIAGFLRGIFPPFNILTKAQTNLTDQALTPRYVQGPFTEVTLRPTVFNGDLRDLPQHPSAGYDIPLPPGVSEESGEADRPSESAQVDPVAQQSLAQGQMPEPIMNFDGLNVVDGGGWYPPDTTGDVGPDHYLQAVKIAIGIYDKATGQELVKLSYNDFFQGPPGSPCDNQNRGDVIVLYDPQVDRWLVTDFALPGPDYYECLAISQSGDPVSGGWYFYELRTNTGYFAEHWHDYPKLGVWADGWYMTANMFSHDQDNYGGARIWALDREDALAGNPIDLVYFDCTDFTHCSSLLPANIRGELSPVGTPEYLSNLELPNSIHIWQFHIDWITPENSTLTGPVPLIVANFSSFSKVPQKETDAWKLDSLGDRLMFQLQYRNINGNETLYANHSVWSAEVGGIRWYEIRDPGSNPYIYQQGTYQPDEHFRWMGSIAADKDGNIALGYSVSSSELFPSIRYAGRMAGEIPNLLTQNEASLVEGGGSQTGSDRWGDYSAMSVDPVDDCTFWYTQEYIKSTGNVWETRIGSFKFPACGEPKGTLEGYVFDPSTSLPWAGAPVTAKGASYTFSTLADQYGAYRMDLVEGSYEVTAGPFLPGYADMQAHSGLVVTPSNLTPLDFQFTP